MAELDHINCVRDDNRLVNLRPADRSLNVRNTRGARSNSVTGLLGASPRQGRYVAQIHADGRKMWLGMYDTPEEAHVAYLVAKSVHHGSF